jgi:hypothetical protein
MNRNKLKSPGKPIARLRARPHVARGLERLEDRLLLAADVVINEIMYHPINPAAPGQAALGEEYIELYNKGDQPANLIGWRIDRGVDYTFTGGAIAPGAYLLVVADTAKFDAKYPGVTNRVGNWTGRLSNSGEEIRIVDNLGGTVDAVEYADQGDWAARRKGAYKPQVVQSITRSGTTATITVINHGFDTGDLVQISGANQAAYNLTMTVGGNYTPNAFTYAVAGSPATPATGNITVTQVNDNGHVGWTWVQAADGDGNSLELRNSALTNNDPHNWISSSAPFGTPGAVNSANTSNIAPMISDLTHFPVVPRSTDPVTVTARVRDELGSASVTLFYRNDGAPGFDSLTMVDNGTGGDLVAGDDIYTAVLGPQGDDTVVEFYVSASDGSLVRTSPGATDDIGTQGANALYQVDNTVYSGAAPIYRLIMTEAERAELADIGNPGNGSENNEHNSNAQMNVTFVAMDGVSTQVRYSAGGRNRGHGSRDNVPNNYRINIPSDKPYNDRTALNFNSQVVYSQIIGSAVHRMAGNAAGEAAGVELRVNGAELLGIYALVEEKDGDFAENHFPDDPQGNIYSAFRLDPTFTPEAELQYLGANGADYAALYPKGSNNELNDYSDLINLTNVLNNASAATFVEDVEQVINLEQWLRYIALDSLMLNQETGMVRGIGDDYAMYRGIIDPRFVLVPHDLDSVLGVAGGNISTSMFSIIQGPDGNGLAGLTRLLSHPDIVPMYYQAMLDVIADTFNPTVLNPLIDQLLTGVTSAGNIAAMKTFIVNRTSAVLAQIPQQFLINTTLPVVNGYPRTTSPNVVLSGSANVSKTRSVMVNGQLMNYDPRTGGWTTPGGGGGATITLVQSGTQGTQGAPTSGPPCTVVGTPGAAGAVWKYLDNGSDQGTAWQTADYASLPWASGPSQLGYNDCGDENTLVGFIDTDTGTAGVQKNFTTYFRTDFNVADRSQIAALSLRLLRDDGAAVYLNGTRLDLGTTAGSVGNMPATVTYTTPALANTTTETTFFTASVDPSLLVNGVNELAVEIHQNTNSSSDISFDLGLEATLVGSGGIPLNPGINRMLVQAFDGFLGTGNEVNRGFVDVWFDGTNATPLPQPSAPVANLELLMPDKYRAGNPILVQVKALDALGNVQRDLWNATVTLATNRGDIGLSTTQLSLRNGLGSVMVTPTGAGTGTFTLIASLADKKISKTISLAPTSMTNVSGTLAGNTTWSGVIHVVGDVIVPAGTTLTIAAGTQILLDGAPSGTTAMDIEVQGRIIANGTTTQPVVFTSFNPAHFWGQIRHVNSQPSTYTYTLINRGGVANGEGHTGTGPTIRGANANVTFDHSVISDTLGKIGYWLSGANSQITMIDSQMARARMGPEVIGTGILLDRTWITDMHGPDDGDGIYLQAQGAGHKIELRNGVISDFDDDGIDTLNSQVLIENYIVRDGLDKGISVFNGGTVGVTVRYSQIVDNTKLSEDPSTAQVSAKADNGATATVNIEHSTILGTVNPGIHAENKTAQNTANIFFNVSNSIIRSPDSVSVDAPYDPNRIVITYSNIGEAWNFAGSGNNINVDPLFVDQAGKNFRLRPGSPSINAGNPAVASNDPDGSRADQGYFKNGIAGTRAPQTIAAGTLGAGNTILSPEGGAYTVTGLVAVPAGATLMVLPGTTVFFNAGAGFNINGGRMLAEGTEYNKIRFARTPGVATPWNGLQFNNTTQDNRITYSVIEGGGTSANNGMVGVTNSVLLLDHDYFANTDRRRLRSNNASIILRNSEFADIFGPGVAPTTDNLSEHFWGSGILPGGVLIVENNIFGTTKGHNDAIDWDTASLPGPIPIFRNNIFMGGGDDAMDLEADALIEGNTFTNFIKDVYNTGTGNSNIISAGDATQVGHNYWFNRNTVFNVEHVIQVKENSFLTFENNTVVNAALAAIYFFRPGQANSWGKGAYLDGNIFVNTPTLFADFQVSTQITVNRSVVSASEVGRGIGNTSGDPRVVNPAAGDFSLRPGSVAIDSGPNGLDMGAMVPAGASVAGEPPVTTWRNTASLTVGGPGIVAYKYKLDSGAWSAETPIANPIALAGLADGAHTVYVIGKNIAGVWQEESNATASRTWTVNASAPRIRINEVLASNVNAFVTPQGAADIIELYNDGPSPVNLQGMAITDTAGNRKYTFGAVTINSGQYLIVFADSKTVAGEVHANFSLRAAGEGVYLYDTLASGGGLIDSVVFGQQLDDLSIGRMADGSWKLNVPTIGAANVAKLTGDPATLKINEWLTDGTQPLSNDFIELYNPDTLPVNLAGLYLTDKPNPQPQKHQIPALSFVGAGGFTVYTADDDVQQGADHTNFKLAHLNGMIGLSSVDGKIDKVLYGPQRTNVSQGRNPDGASTMAFFSPPSPGLTNLSGGASTSPLRITEVNYNAPGAGALSGDEYEYIELTNTGAGSINLNGFKFTAGVVFTFGNIDLPAGARIVVVKNQAAFTDRYGTGITIAGTFTDSLDNNGEGIRLLDAGNQVVHDFVYSDTWVPSTDGDGFTLTIVDPTAAVPTWNTPAAWRASKHILGTPGIAEHALAAGAVVINEVNSNAPAGGSWIELLNTTASPVNIGGWYLTDTLGNTRKFRIAPGTTIGVGASAYLVFNEATLGFALSRLGGDAFLSSSATLDVLSGYHDGVSFGATDPGVTLGRHVLSTGAADFTALSSPTQNGANTYPKVGPVVINEVMYNPNGNGEFIELMNITNQFVPMYDPANPTNTWKFADGVDFTFPEGVSLAPFERVLIVSQISDDFRSNFGIPDSVRIFQFLGALDNSGESVRLSKPGVPDIASGTVPYISVDRVRYGTSAPWPGEPNGTGPSLARKAKNEYGNEPLNWAASDGNGGTPGQPNDEGANPTIGGTNGNDVFYVKLDGGGSFVEVYLTNPPGGAPAYSFPINSVESLGINGLGGDDRLYWDFGLGGIPSLFGGLRFDGGTQASPAGDTVDVIGHPSLSGKFTPTSGAGGVVQVDFGVLSIAGLDEQGVTVHGFGAFTYVAPFGTDVVDADTPVAGRTRLSGAIDGEALADLAYYGIGTMVIDLGSASLNIGAASSIDLGSGDMILRSSAATKNALLAAVGDYIRSGRNRGAWNGPGMISSAAAANTARNTGLAAILNDNGAGSPLMGTFNGQAVDANSILIKYTYDGDGDVDGDVDADDYARLDAGFAQRNNVGFVPSYRNGDLDYSDSINSDDFFVIDRAFSSQSSPLAAIEPEAAAASQPLIVQKTAAKKQKHRRRPAVRENMFRREWKSVARY